MESGVKSSFDLSWKSFRMTKNFAEFTRSRQQFVRHAGVLSVEVIGDRERAVDVSNAMTAPEMMVDPPIEV